MQADKQVDEILQYISTSIKSALRLSTAIESISSPVSNIFTIQTVVKKVLCVNQMIFLHWPYKK